MNITRILSITVSNREIDAAKVRNIIAEYSDEVRASEGIMEVTKEKGGLMMVELKGDSVKIDKMEHVITLLEGVGVESTTFQNC